MATERLEETNMIAIDHGIKPGDSEWLRARKIAILSQQPGDALDFGWVMIHGHPILIGEGGGGGGGGGGHAAAHPTGGAAVAPGGDGGPQTHFGMDWKGARASTPEEHQQQRELEHNFRRADEAHTAAPQGSKARQDAYVRRQQAAVSLESLRDSHRMMGSSLKAVAPDIRQAYHDVTLLNTKRSAMTGDRHAAGKLSAQHLHEIMPSSQGSYSRFVQSQDAFKARARKS